MRSLLSRLLAQTTLPSHQTIESSGRVLGFCFILAAVAGLFGAIAKKLSLRDTFIAAGVSGVGGVVVGALCVYLWGADKWYLTCAACSLAGWAGGNLILDRLTFVAWTIAQGKLPQLGNLPVKEQPREARASSVPSALGPIDPLADLDDLPSVGGPRDRRGPEPGL